MKRLVILLVAFCSTIAMFAQADQNGKLTLDLQNGGCSLKGYQVDKSGLLFLIMSDDPITIETVRVATNKTERKKFLINDIDIENVQNFFDGKTISLKQDTLKIKWGDSEWQLRTIPKMYDLEFKDDSTIVYHNHEYHCEENKVFRLPTTGEGIHWLRSETVGDLKIQEGSSTIEVLKEPIKSEKFAYYQTNGDFKLKADKVYTFTIGDKSWKVNYPQEQAANNRFQPIKEFFKVWGWKLLIGIVVLLAIFGIYKKIQKHPQRGVAEPVSSSEEQGNENLGVYDEKSLRRKLCNQQSKEKDKELSKNLQAKIEEQNKKSKESPVQGKNDTAKAISKILLQVNNRPDDDFKRLGEIWKKKECGKTNESLRDFFTCIEKEIKNNPVPTFAEFLQKKNNSLSPEEEKALYQYVYAQLTDKGISAPPQTIDQLAERLKQLDTENGESPTDTRERNSNPEPNLVAILQQKNNGLSQQEEEALYQHVCSQLRYQEISTPPSSIDKLAEQLKQLANEKNRLEELESVSREMEECGVSTVEELKQQIKGKEMDEVRSLHLPEDLTIEDCTEPHQVVSKLIAYTENIENQQSQTQQRIDQVKDVLCQYGCEPEDGNEAEELRRWCEQQKAEQDRVQKENTELKEQKEKTIEKIKECFDSDCDNLHEYVKQGGILRACDSSDSSERLRNDNEDMLNDEMEKFMNQSGLSIEGDCPEVVYKNIQVFLQSQLEGNSILNLIAQYYAYSRLAFMTDRRQGGYGVFIHQEKMTTVFNSMNKLLADFGIQIILPTLFAEKLTANSFENAIGHAGNLNNLCPESINYKEDIPVTDKRGIMIDLICPGYSVDGQVVKKAQVTIL